MYQLEWTPAFVKAAKRFAKQHPELKQKTAMVLLALEQDPFQPSLKLHGLGGKFKGLHAVRVTYSYRVTLVLKIIEHVVILLDIEKAGQVAHDPLIGNIFENLIVLEALKARYNQGLKSNLYFLEIVIMVIMTNITMTNITMTNLTGY